MAYSRRVFLASALPAATLATFGVSVAATKPGCPDVDHLSDSQLSLSKSLSYTDHFEDAKQTCADCAFYHAMDSGQCGNCDILSRPVSATGHCVSWSQKS